MTFEETITILKSKENPVNRVGMARFGIPTENALGISIKELQPITKLIKTDHQLGIQLWNTGIHEARILAILISDPKLLTLEQLDKWTNDFNGWDVCDQACNKLYRFSDLAIERISYWIDDEKEFVRRTSFSMLATLAVHKKGEKYDGFFVEYFPQIIKHSTDERNFVKKAVNWAIRQIGKRSDDMRNAALKLCDEIIKQHPESKSAKWITSDARRELTYYDFANKGRKNNNKRVGK